MVERRYGQWSGSPKGRPEDKTRCIKEVWPTGRSWIPYQCTRRRGHGKDGLYDVDRNPPAMPNRTLLDINLKIQVTN